MVGSLFTTGFLFIFLQYIQSFYSLAFSIFFIMVIADMFRPAMFVAVGAYSKENQRPKAMALIRLAINIGFIIGPAAAGFVINYSGYNSIFWIDGITCIISILIFAFYVKEKKNPKTEKKTARRQNILKSDPSYVFFLLGMVMIGVLFFQLFTTLPLYHKEHFLLSEKHTGLIFTFNAILVISLEMPIVNYLNKKKLHPLKIVIGGAFLMGISFFFLLYTASPIILLVSMLFISIGEILAFPFSNEFAMSRSKSNQVGMYMALYTMSFSIAHIFSSKIGMDTIEAYGYQINWSLMGGLGILSIVFYFISYHFLKKETK